MRLAVVPWLLLLRLLLSLLLLLLLLQVVLVTFQRAGPRRLALALTRTFAFAITTRGRIFTGGGTRFGGVFGATVATLSATRSLASGNGGGGGGAGGNVGGGSAGGGDLTTNLGECTVAGSKHDVGRILDVESPAFGIGGLDTNRHIRFGAGAGATGCGGFTTKSRKTSG